MKRINGKIYYGVTEASKKLHMAFNTLQRKIKDKEIPVLQYMSTKYISKEFIDLYLKKNRKELYITPKMLKEDRWLQNKDNLQKLNSWRHSEYINWKEFDIHDMVAYYRYFVMEQWKIYKEENGKSTDYPTVRWLNNNFAGFRKCFEYGYFDCEPYNMKTIADFWKYLKGKNWIKG
jgi:hypothetical protein